MFSGQQTNLWPVGADGTAVRFLVGEPLIEIVILFIAVNEHDVGSVVATKNELLAGVANQLIAERVAVLLQVD